MTSKYKFEFSHNVPTWNELTGSNMTFLKLNILMKVYENDELIYSIISEINGIYSCCGSKNFEFDKMNHQIIKNCNNLDVIRNELLSIYKNIFKDTVLDIWKYRVCDELCWH